MIALALPTQSISIWNTGVLLCGRNRKGVDIFLGGFCLDRKTLPQIISVIVIINVKHVALNTRDMIAIMK